MGDNRETFYPVIFVFRKDMKQTEIRNLFSLSPNKFQRHISLFEKFSKNRDIGVAGFAVTSRNAVCHVSLVSDYQ